MDLSITMNVPGGSTLVFGSRISIDDNCSKPQDSLMKILVDQAILANTQEALDNLIEKVDNFSNSDSIQTWKQFESHSGMVTLPESDSKTADIRVHHPEVPLTGAQQGLVLSTTPEGNIVH